MRGAAVGLAMVLAAAAALAAYPLDGYEKTGIRRLLAYRLALEGELKTSLRLPPGAQINSQQVSLRLHGRNDDFDIRGETPRDPYLQQGLERIFAERDPSYNIVLLEINDPRNPRYAALRPHESRIPGSVGKLLVATGLFHGLKLAYPEDTAARERVLRETVVTADRFVHRDGKTVPFFDPGGDRIVRRRIEAGDRFSLWEWLDHMLSVSSNAAGSMVWKEAMLLRKFGRQYPPSREQREEFLNHTAKTDLREYALETLEEPLREAGLDPGKLRLGTFFTNNASAAIPGTASYATAHELMRWLIKLEQGKIVDPWASLEVKKAMYFSRPRYRYASSPALDGAAVYFKSGSLFRCKQEPGFTCKAYAGNVLNLMHSVAIVESGEKAYLVTMMSNILRKNSAVEHQSAAGEIEKLVQSRPER